MPPLARLQSLDDGHFAAFNEMLAQYRRVGENDAAFRALVVEVEARVAEEQAARAHAERFEAWGTELVAALKQIGKHPEIMQDRYNFFEGAFNAGTSPMEAALSTKPMTSRADEQ